MIWGPSKGNKVPKKWLELRVLMLDLMKSRKSWKDMIGERIRAKCSKLEKIARCICSDCSMHPLISGDMDGPFCWEWRRHPSCEGFIFCFSRK